MAQATRAPTVAPSPRRDRQPAASQQGNSTWRRPLPSPQAANERRDPGRPRPPRGAPAADWPARAQWPPHVGRGRGVNEVEAIPPPPRLPPAPGAARPPRRPVPSPPAGPLHPILASGSPGPGPRVVDPRWPSAARCPSASWRGRTCPPRTCERCRAWGPQLSGEGRCPLSLTFLGSTRPAHKWSSGEGVASVAAVGNWKGNGDSKICCEHRAGGDREGPWTGEGTRFCKGPELAGRERTAAQEGKGL